MQWANGSAELDRLRRFCIAYEYVQAEKIRDSAVGDVEQVKAKISEIDENIGTTRLEILEMEKQVSNLTAEKEASMGGEVKILSDKVDKLSQGLVLEVSVLNNKDDNLRSEKENAKKIVRNIEDLKQSIEEKASSVRRSEEGAADLKKRVEELSKSLEEYEKDYQGVLAGKSSGNQEKCLEDQLRDAKVAVGSAETETKQLKTKINHCEKELKEKRHQLLSKREEAAAAENEFNARRKDVEKVKLELESVSYKEGLMEALQKACLPLPLHTTTRQKKKASHDRAFEMELVQKLQLGNVQFSYRDPVKNFDRSKVKGVVAKLIKVKNSSTMTALEVGRENAELTLSLFGYSDELKTAMEYVFGSTCVCKTTDVAKEVAFNHGTRTPTVTLDGDIFQPSGLLTGGSCW
ncbi:hypothetical protein LWI28_014745 [Acer negundo]|uniref:Structural maintenance of chromosomes protein 2 n=1 Tax=Acer negundo TaxID=4023 RepID=A0AAD5IE28_ACENE|nr:hypothetical protein LWI28_014745 [Acer negundo]